MFSYNANNNANANANAFVNFQSSETYLLPCEASMTEPFC